MRGFHLFGFTRGCVNKGNRARPAFAIHQNFAGQRILPKGEFSGGGGFGQRASRRSEDRGNVAAIHAVAAIMAGRAVVIGLGQNRLAHRNERNIQGVRGALQDLLTAPPGQRRQVMLAPGQD